MITVTKLPGRNEICVCKSGQKFKKCCLPKIQEHEASLRALLLNPRRAEDPEFVASGMDFEAFKLQQIRKLENLKSGRR